MNTYEYEYFYRYGNDQQDCERVEIEAETESAAYLKVKEIRKWVFGIKLISINGIKV